MRIALFCHSLLSDWNHGNAHFLRGVVGELVARGHEVLAFEPREAWSVLHLIAERGEAALDVTREVYPFLRVRRYDLDELATENALERALEGTALLLVHEWNDPALVARLGAYRARHPATRALFHDTHHRAVTDPGAMARYDLSAYDGVLAFGAVIRDLYLARRWARAAFVWHEAADTRVFRPQEDTPKERDLVWIGNFGDGERTAELETFLLGPIRDLGLSARLYGVRYPKPVLARLAASSIDYRGFLPNYRAPGAFARARLTVHVPRRPYVESLPGIPTIRPFEALACGIPLVSSPWHDAEGLFTEGCDYLVARDGDAMKRALRDLLAEPAMARELAEHGLATVLARHTCAHRVAELLRLVSDLGLDVTSPLETHGCREAPLPTSIPTPIPTPLPTPIPTLIPGTLRAT